MLKEPAAVIVELIRSYLGLRNDQVVQYNDQKVWPNNQDIYIVVKHLSSVPYSNNRKLVVDNGVVPPVATETIFTTTKEIYTIEIASAISRESIARKEEMLESLRGYFSLTRQYQNNFRIMPLPSRINNISTKEGGSMMNRFAVDIVVFASYQSSRPVQIFDTFDYNLYPNS